MERPILMTAESVKAILDGRKAQTRRVQGLGLTNLSPDSYIVYANDFGGFIEKNLRHFGKREIKCPYGQVGDRLWVRETHYRYGRWVKDGLTKSGKQAWKFFATTDEVLYYDDVPRKLHSRITREEIARERLSDWYKRPSIFLPFRFSRITLEITEVRVERVQEIESHPEDYKAEGYTPLMIGKSAIDGQPFEASADFAWFENLWDSINGKKYPWSSNPWVWAIKFDNIGVRVK